MQCRSSERRGWAHTHTHAHTTPHSLSQLSVPKHQFLFTPGNGCGDREAAIGRTCDGPCDEEHADMYGAIGQRHSGTGPENAMRLPQMQWGEMHGRSL